MLTVVGKTESVIFKRDCGTEVIKMVKAICDCGNECEVPATRVKSGKTKSCGCLGIKNLELGRQSTHGLHAHHLNYIWVGMKQRCYNKSNEAYKNYGGRGITVCDEWRNSLKSFYDWCMANGYSPELQLDRKENNGNYEPSNCRFVTAKINSNNRRDTRMVILDGEEIALSLACDKLGLRHVLIYGRMQAGKTFEEAIKM
mgnify:CR=1 FL=1